MVLDARKVAIIENGTWSPSAGRTIKEILDTMKEIEIAGKIPFTGIVNNSNLGKETTAEDILSSLSFADEVSSLTGLPVRFTSVTDRLYSQLEGKIENLFPLKLQNTINSII